MRRGRGESRSGGRTGKRGLRGEARGCGVPESGEGARRGAGQCLASDGARLSRTCWEGSTGLTGAKRIPDILRGCGGQNGRGDTGLVVFRGCEGARGCGFRESWDGTPIAIVGEC